MNFDRSDTSAKIVALISTELSVEKKAVVESASLSDLGADSLDMVEIIMKLEEQFGIEIKDEEAEQLKTVKDIIDFVQASRTK